MNTSFEELSKTQPPLTITFNTSIYNLGLSSIVIMQIITVHDDTQKNVKRETNERGMSSEVRKLKKRNKNRISLLSLYHNIQA